MLSMNGHRNKKKSVQLITDEFLGRITLCGFVAPKTKRIMRRFDQIAGEEYGALFLLDQMSTDLIDGLKNNFPE